MSSSNNGNNSGVFPLSLYLSSVSGHQDIIPNAYNHYHQMIASPGQMASAVPNSLVNYMAFNSNNQQGSGLPEVSREVKKPVKKDRHSKIHTAQGLRDRRVRLSIGIARQFFDLQDMLGFDKASKTLDWLLNKSRKAIKKVVQAKNLNNDGQNFGNNGDNDDNEEEEEDEEEDDDDDDDGHKSFVYGWSPKYYQEEAVCEVMKEENRRQKSDLSNISSEGSRAKAKGKAKERRKELTYDHQETASEITQSEIIDPFQRSIIFNDGEDMTYSSYKETIEEFNNQESILTKRKINLPTNMGQNYNQQNGAYMLMDQGSSSNYNTIMPHNFDYNYDQNPFVDQPFCGVTDTNFPKGLP